MIGNRAIRTEDGVSLNLDHGIFGGALEACVLGLVDDCSPYDLGSRLWAHLFFVCTAEIDGD